MNTVIIICNDPRMVLVKEVLQPLLLAKISIVPDFDSGLKEVFEKRPPLVFIQDEIAGVKGETVTRHIRSLLQGNSPGFIPLSHDAGGPGVNRKSDDGINLDLADEALVAAFNEHLEKAPGIRWKEQVTILATSGFSPQQQAGATEDELFGFFKHQDDDKTFFPAVEPCVFDNGGKSPSVSPPLKTETASASAAPVAVAGAPSPELSTVSGNDELPSSRPDQPDVVPVQFGQESPAAMPERVPGLPVDRQHEPVPVNDWMTGDFADEFPFPAEPVPPPRFSSKVLYAVVGVIALLICGVALYIFFPDPPKPSTAIAPPARTALPPPPAAPAPSSVSTVSTQPVPAVPAFRDGLPSFIPKEGADTAYGTARAGWERYVSPRREYLLFREQGVLRALQVIALKKGAIDDAFMASALREICGDATCVILSRTSRDGYVVEEGRTATKAEVVFYKKKGETRGVVITLP